MGYITYRKAVAMGNSQGEHTVGQEVGMTWGAGGGENWGSSREKFRESWGSG